MAAAPSPGPALLESDVYYGSARRLGRLTLDAGGVRVVSAPATPGPSESFDISYAALLDFKSSADKPGGDESKSYRVMLKVLCLHSCSCSAGVSALPIFGSLPLTLACLSAPLVSTCPCSTPPPRGLHLRK